MTIDGAEQFFTRARDFGYSKSHEETMRLWPTTALWSYSRCDERLSRSVDSKACLRRSPHVHASFLVEKIVWK